MMLLSLFGAFKGFKISWKMILVALAALGIVVSIHSAWNWVEDLQTQASEAKAKVERLQGETNMARFERNIAEEQAKAMIDAQADLARRMNEFHAERSQAEEAIRLAREELRRLDLEKEISNDAQAARDRLNARTRELNRLLEGSSRF